MTKVTLPRYGVALTARGDQPSAEFYRWMHDITERVGGALGTGTDDLSVSQFEDAGIEETKAAVNAITELVAQNIMLASALESLSATVSYLLSRVDGNEQGTLQ